VKEILSYFQSSTFGFLLKLFTGLAAALFGILGVGANVRDQNGRLNRKGWTALIGIVIAGLLAVATSVYDFIAGQRQDETARAKNEQLLLSVRRGIYPLRKMRVDINISLKPSFGGLSEYKAILRQHFSKEALKELNAPQPIRLTAGIFDIDRSSPLFPAPTSSVYLFISNITFHVVPLSAYPEDRIPASIARMKFVTIR